MRLIPTVLGAAILGIGATTALGAPSLSDPALSPSSLESHRSAPRRPGLQNDFDPGLAGPAVVEVNDASDGSASGAWSTVGDGQPVRLRTGAQSVLAFSVADSGRTPSGPRRGRRSLTTRRFDLGRPPTRPDGAHGVVDQPHPRRGDDRGGLDPVRRPGGDGPEPAAHGRGERQPRRQRGRGVGAVRGAADARRRAQAGADQPRRAARRPAPRPGTEPGPGGQRVGARARARDVGRDGAQRQRRRSSGRRPRRPGSPSCRTTPTTGPAWGSRPGGRRWRSPAAGTTPTWRCPASPGRGACW